MYVCMLLIITILPITAIAGDENDPEITDNLDDQFGAVVDHPYRMRTLIAKLLLQMNSFDFIDIDSAWFYEIDLEPDFLYAALKLKDLTPNPQRAIYSIHFTTGVTAYSVGSHLCNNAQNALGFIGLDKRFNRDWEETEAAFDFDTNIVTFKLDKQYIGNPQPGDVITKTFAWTALRFNYELFSLLFSDGELVKDAAPFKKNTDEYGRDYVILY